MTEEEIQAFHQDIQELKGQMHAHRTLTGILISELAKSRGNAKAFLEVTGKALISSTDSFDAGPETESCRNEYIEIFETALRTT